MATTALFVEILVIGALAEIWFGAVLLSLLNTDQIKSAISALGNAKDIGPLLTILVLAVTYAVGWVVNFAAERLFKRAFEARVRDVLFGNEPARYDLARAVVYQKGSPELLRDLHLDRHIVRIARTNVLNFTLLAVALLLHLPRLETSFVLVSALACLAVATGSFAQWRTRYEAYYGKVARAAEIIDATKA